MPDEKKRRSGSGDEEGAKAESALEGKLEKLAKAFREKQQKTKPQDIRHKERTTGTAVVTAPENPVVVSDISQADSSQLEFFFFGEPHSPKSRDLTVMMDVAVFRLSKAWKAENTTIRYELSDGTVTVTSGPHGMATIYDYDLMMMAAGHLTYGIERNSISARKAPHHLGGKIFRPAIADILRFLGREHGGRQAAELRKMLLRLNTTHVYIERKKTAPNGDVYTISSAENLINSFRMIADDTGKPHWVEIHLSDLVYTEIVAPFGSTPGVPRVLSINPRYFSLTGGIARFIYRIARRAAGTSKACYSFENLHKRSGSSGELKRFTYELRKIISAGALLDYDLSEIKGKDGPLLEMRFRGESE